MLRQKRLTESPQLGNGRGHWNGPLMEEQGGADPQGQLQDPQQREG